MPTPISIDVAIASPQAGPQYVEEQARLLRQEIEHLGITTRQVTTPGPSGARGAAELLGVLQLVLIPALAPKLFDLLQTWLSNRKDSTVKLTIGKDILEVEFSPEHTSAAQLDTFLGTVRKHAQPEQD